MRSLSNFTFKQPWRDKEGEKCDHFQILRLSNLEGIKKERSAITFKFENEKVFKSIKRVTLPAVFANKNIFLTNEIIKNEIPMLVSKETMTDD